MSINVHSLQVNPLGGVPKFQVPSIEVHLEGVHGDKQKDTKHHGGLLKAVSLFSLEVIHILQHEGHPIDCGTTGENITLAGLDWTTISEGVRLEIGQVMLEVTMFAQPCKTIRNSFSNGKFNRIAEKSNPGFSRVYAKVIQEGTIHTGDIVTIH